MANRSTRTKIKFQCDKSIKDVENALNHLAQLAALSDERSGFIDHGLPPIMSTLQMVLVTLQEFRKGL